MAVKRIDGRKANELRPVTITRHYTDYAPGSVLITMGGTRVLCTAYVEDRVPPWLEGSGQGWLTAEYGMLPSSTPQRRRRDDGRGDGRSQEIRRLVGRSLRAAVDLGRLDGVTVFVDCDVLQADGGTRTASVTGAYVAVADAMAAAMREGLVVANPLKGAVAAVSAGVVDGGTLLDLNYDEDSRADVDFNVVMTAKSEFVEVQGTAERGTFGGDALDRILTAARRGIRQLLKAQRDALRNA